MHLSGKGCGSNLNSYMPQTICRGYGPLSQARCPTPILIQIVPILAKFIRNATHIRSSRRNSFVPRTIVSSQRHPMCRKVRNVLSTFQAFQISHTSYYTPEKHAVVSKLSSGLSGITCSNNCFRTCPTRTAFVVYAWTNPPGTPRLTRLGPLD